jgi:hypothetical protein
MATVLYDSAMPVHDDRRDQFILAARRIVEQEAWKVARWCPDLAIEDLCAEGMLFLVEKARALMAAERSSEAYTRMAVRDHLRRYGWQFGQVLRKPTTRTLRQAFTILDLDGPVTEDGELCLADVVPAPVDTRELEYAALRQALRDMPDLLRRALLLRYSPRGRQRVRAFPDVARELGVERGVAKRLVAEAEAIVRRDLVGEVAR